MAHSDVDVESVCCERGKMKNKDFDFFVVGDELDLLSKYLDLTKSAIEENTKQFLNWRKGQIKDLSEDGVEEFDGVFEDDYNEIAHDFPRLLYSSFVVTWYSFVEHFLVDQCRKSNLRLSVSVDDNERYGEGINRAYNFLLRAGKYQIDKMHWDELKRIGKVRNQLVHNSGRIIFSDATEALNNQKNVKVIINNNTEVFLSIENEIFDYLESHKMIRLGEVVYINPDYKFCRYLIGFGKTMLSKIESDLRKRANQEFSKRIKEIRDSKPTLDDWFPNLDN